MTTIFSPFLSFVDIEDSSLASILRRGLREDRVPAGSFAPTSTFYYRLCHEFGQAYNLVKLGDGDSVFGFRLKHFSLQPPLPQKMTLTSKVVKSDSKLIISLC